MNCTAATRPGLPWEWVGLYPLEGTWGLLAIQEEVGGMRLLRVWLQGAPESFETRAEEESHE